jgi:hypothetical protein
VGQHIIQELNSFARRHTGVIHIAGNDHGVRLLLAGQVKDLFEQIGLVLE